VSSTTARPLVSIFMCERKGTYLGVNVVLFHLHLGIVRIHIKMNDQPVEMCEVLIAQDVYLVLFLKCVSVVLGFLFIGFDGQLKSLDNILK